MYATQGEAQPAHVEKNASSLKMANI